MARPTIFARSSGPAPAGVAVFRISGPLAGPALEQLTGTRGTPRRARLTTLRRRDGSTLDEGLALWFPGPGSFTGEDVAELHLHGSVAVERALADEMSALGIEPATAGAFTLRAFEAGRLDLAQAEGLADLLSAETEGQRRQALGQLGGRLSERAEAWRAELLRIFAMIEASLDFPDEEDVPDSVADGLATAVQALRTSLRDALDGAEVASRLRDGVRVVLTGPPNAGKSSLLNALAGEERAIVSEVAGTTRDVVEVRTEIAGHLVVLTDTAGLRDTSDPVERIGVVRAEAARVSADIVLLLCPARQIVASPTDPDVIALASRADEMADDATLPDGWVPVSVRTNDGTAELMAMLRSRLGRAAGGVLTRTRHVAAVRAALTALPGIDSDILRQPELVAACLQRTLRHLDELTGRIAPDEVLGAIFAEFCIGK